MNAEAKAQALAHFLEKSKERNYRKHISNEIVALIAKDVLNTIDEWEGPEYEDADADDVLRTNQLE
jgi:hypothetical protein